MSSDTYHLRILRIEGAEIDLECITTTAGGVNDYAFTRSFVLMALGEDGPEGTLRSALSGKPFYQEAWMRDHVGEYIVSTKSLGRFHYVSDEETWGKGRNALGQTLREQGMGEMLVREKLDEQFPRHRTHLRATVTDPKWLEGLEVGMMFGTTAYDAWWNDPVRPERLTQPQN